MKLYMMNHAPADRKLRLVGEKHPWSGALPGSRPAGIPDIPAVLPWDKPLQLQLHKPFLPNMGSWPSAHALARARELCMSQAQLFLELRLTSRLSRTLGCEPDPQSWGTRRQTWCKPFLALRPEECTLSWQCLSPSSRLSRTPQRPLPAPSRRRCPSHQPWPSQRSSSRAARGRCRCLACHPPPGWGPTAGAWRLMGPQSRSLPASILASPGYRLPRSLAPFVSTGRTGSTWPPWETALSLGQCQ